MNAKQNQTASPKGPVMQWRALVAQGATLVIKGWQIVTVAQSSKDGFSFYVKTLDDGSKYSSCHYHVYRKGADKIRGITVQLVGGEEFEVVIRSLEDAKAFQNRLSEGTMTRADLVAAQQATDRAFPVVGKDWMDTTIRKEAL